MEDLDFDIDKLKEKLDGTQRKAKDLDDEDVFGGGRRRVGAPGARARELRRALRGRRRRDAARGPLHVRRGAAAGRLRDPGRAGPARVVRRPGAARRRRAARRTGTRRLRVAHGPFRVGLGRGTDDHVAVT